MREPAAGRAADADRGHHAPAVLRRVAACLRDTVMITLQNVGVEYARAEHLVAGAVAGVLRKCWACSGICSVSAPLPPAVPSVSSFVAGRRQLLAEEARVRGWDCALPSAEAGGLSQCWSVPAPIVVGLRDVTDDDGERGPGFASSCTGFLDLRPCPVFDDVVSLVGALRRSAQVASMLLRTDVVVTNLPHSVAQ